MTTLFVPGIADEAIAIETAYGEMRRQTELDMGRRPNSRRILSIWMRRGNLDCVTRVGSRDPLRGGTVIAILDLGPREPYVVWWQREPGIGAGVQEVVGCSAYSVLEFDA
ncbi:MAG TPA: hypothetical protein VMF57_10705 [Solirubrobacteraceae bacterium]|nr:hypothetical protein [Solirubrobacteraceae bacterium]